MPKGGRTTQFGDLCKECGIKLDSSNCAYHKHYVRTVCRNCALKCSKRWDEKNKERRRLYKRNYVLGIKYNMTKEQEEQLLKSQGGVCAICRTNDEQLVIDHDHITKEIRGILCYSCNAAIGMIKEDEDRIWNMMEYLKKYKWSKVS